VDIQTAFDNPKQLSLNLLKVWLLLREKAKKKMKEKGCSSCTTTPQGELIHLQLLKALG